MSRWPALLGALGAVMFGFGLLTLLMASFQPLMPAAMVYGNLIVGLLLLAASASSSFDSIMERVRSGGGRRRGLRATASLLEMGLVLAILAMLAFLSTRYSHRFDWSEQRINTLSDASLELLSQLEGDVVLTAFFQRQDSPMVRDLLERYDYAGENLEVQFVDPNVRPDLVEAHQLDAIDLARGLILATRGDASVQIVEFSESEITNALVKLTRRAERKVYFVEGHNERRIPTAVDGEPDPGAAPGQTAPDAQREPGEESAEGRAGFSRVAASLRNETYEVESLLLASAEEIPADADALVIAGPTRPFFESEIALLERYLAGGGSLLVMIDPRAQTNLDALLERWGVGIGDDVVVDPLQSLSRQPTAPVSESHAKDHPIGASLARTVFPMARSVSVLPSARDSGLREIVFSGDASWAESDLDGWVRSGQAMLDDADLAGPVSLVVAGRPLPGGAPSASASASAAAVAGSEGAPADAKLVVIGDSSFATNEYFDAFGNRDLLLNSVSWLLGDVEHIAVRPNLSRSSSLVLTAREFQAIQYFSLLVLPEGIALVGVLIWWSRRRSAGP